MTVVGIAGCTALMLTAFGLYDSINDVAYLQFDELCKYNTIIVADKEKKADDMKDLTDAVEADKRFKDSALVSQKAVSVSHENNSVTSDVYLMVAHDPEDLQKLITLRTRVEGKGLTLSDKGVILTEKLADKLGVSVGDEVVIGENGENINPDSVEKLFTFSSATVFSVLGLGDKDTEELSLIVQISPFAGDSTIAKTRDEAYAVNDTLPTATRIKRFFFTTDELCPPTAVKVSRAQLKAKIQKGEVALTPFNEMKSATEGGVDSPLMKKVVSIIAEVLLIPCENITPDSHIFHDLDATSIQYITIVTKLSESFTLSDYNKDDKYCYTPREICEYIERHL